MFGYRIVSTIRGASAAIMTLAALSACDSPTEAPPAPDAPAVVSIEIQGATSGVSAGDHVALTAVTRSEDGRPLSRTVAWSSSDTAIATISDAGLMTAVAPGVVRIDASAGNVLASVSVYVRDVAPVLAHLLPATATAGDQPFELTVTGSGFSAGASLWWNGQPRPTRVISRTEVRADITAADLQTAGVAQIAVVNSPHEGGHVSDRLPFTVQQPPVTWTTWRLVGDQTSRTLPAQTGAGVHVDSTGATHQVIRRALAGTFRMRHQAGSATQWEQVVTIATYLQGTGTEIDRDSLVWWGTVEYNLWDGSMVLIHGGLPISYRTRVHDEDETGNDFVLFQGLDAQGADRDSGWLYVRDS